MDYNSLVSTVASRLNRTDLSAIIPDCVARAEEEIFARLAADPVRPMQNTASGTALTANITVPTDFIDAIDLIFTLGSDTWRVARLGLGDDPDYYDTRALPYGASFDSSKIRHYTLINRTIVLPSAPDSPTAYSLRYFQKPAALSTGTLTNWIIDSHGDVYEFGTLMHAARHIRDDNLEDRMKANFATAIGLMMEAYPERQNVTARFEPDAPWSNQQPWNIVNGY